MPNAAACTGLCIFCEKTTVASAFIMALRLLTHTHTLTHKCAYTLFALNPQADKTALYKDK